MLSQEKAIPACGRSSEDSSRIVAPRSSEEATGPVSRGSSSTVTATEDRSAGPSRHRTTGYRCPVEGCDSILTQQGRGKPKDALIKHMSARHKILYPSLPAARQTADCIPPKHFFTDRKLSRGQQIARYLIAEAD